MKIKKNNKPVIRGRRPEYKDMKEDKSMSVYVCRPLSVCLYYYKHISTCKYVHVSLFEYVCSCMCMHLCVRVGVCVYTCSYLYVCLCACISEREREAKKNLKKQGIALFCFLTKVKFFLSGKLKKNKCTRGDKINRIVIKTEQMADPKMWSYS